MNNTEKKIDWIFEALRFRLEDTPADSQVGKINLLNNADRIIADIETEKEQPPIQNKTKQALSDAPRDR